MSECSPCLLLFSWRKNIIWQNKDAGLVLSISILVKSTFLNMDKTHNFFAQFATAAAFLLRFLRGLLVSPTSECAVGTFLRAAAHSGGISIPVLTESYITMQAIRFFLLEQQHSGKKDCVKSSMSSCGVTGSTQNYCKSEPC
ncbi:unnamed protein product [Amoebophrya sp. A120]|nr:unnamed protein product [Amoebophrya sp. A120]|eukprot:GSA120T00015693001.1